jgi:hypothetical protein
MTATFAHHALMRAHIRQAQKQRQDERHHKHRHDSSTPYDENKDGHY